MCQIMATPIIIQLYNHSTHRGEVEMSRKAHSIVSQDYLNVWYLLLLADSLRLYYYPLAFTPCSTIFVL